jgi:hypothetical protein
MPPITTQFTQQIPSCAPYQNLTASLAHTRRVNQETLTAAGGDVLTGCCETCGDILVIHPTSPALNPPPGSLGAFGTTYGQRENGLVQDLFRTTGAAPHEFLSPTFDLTCNVADSFTGVHNGTIIITGPGTFTGSATGTASGAASGAYTISLTGTGDASSGSFTGSISGVITGTFSGTYPEPSPTSSSTIFTISAPTPPAGSIVVARSAFSVSTLTFSGAIRCVNRCYERATWTSCNRGGLVLEVFRDSDDVLLFDYANKHHGVRSMADALLLLRDFNCAACFLGAPQALCAQTWTFDAVGIP